MNPQLTKIPLTRREMAEFQTAFSRATEVEIGCVQRLLDAMPDECLSRMAKEALPVCYHEGFLSMVYASKAIGSNASIGAVVDLLSDITHKRNSLLIEPDVHSALVTSLIRGYGGAGKASLLPHLDLALKLNSSDAQIPGLGEAIDQALSEHVRRTPCQENHVAKDSWRSLRLLELPKALEAFTIQMIADGRYESVQSFIVDAFRSNTLGNAYLETFRRMLGDDVVSHICISTHDVFECSFEAVSKITPWAGEDRFHTDKFLAAVKKDLVAKNRSCSPYINGFAFAGADEAANPILARFVMTNLKSILREPKEVTEIRCVVSLIAMATRCGKGKEALKHLITGAVTRTVALQVDGIYGAPMTPIVGLLEELVASDFPHPKVMAQRSLLLKATSVVGLETLKEVMPNVPASFIVALLEKCTADLSKSAVLKLFPHAKAKVLESDLGM